jgi:hypothetical protein
MSLDKDGRYAEGLLRDVGNLGTLGGKSDGKQQERLFVGGPAEDLV